MDLSSLHAFLQVAQTGSFSEAADRLFLTQPAISKRIAGLENTLGTRLFDRIGRRVSLTEAGSALLPRARDLINAANDIKRLASTLTGEVAGTLAFATSHHIGLHRLPPILRAFTRDHPQVRMDIRFLDSEVASRAVESGELELAIVTLPESAPPMLDSRAIWHDRLLFVAAPDHPLAQEPSIPPQRLAEFPAVLPGSTTYTRAILDRALRGHGVSLDRVQTTNYLETLKMLAAAGLGWSLLPHTLLDGDLVPLNVEGIELGRQLGILIHRDRTLGNAARRMIELCIE
ncbi:MAG: LysR family transcriptional regulator [Gammaproteobacteria bacterium RIFOXYA12_FULL_61_12]|nr:MAG: LysR family transcriptional regulator [Gammaproteobacteria bacterium RIFOXYD12_FULL_61_37]OGT92831.1 MAG: LysR family transcriptional regulator [Gammaproteobacteria bacterium RIFOXYA12_FULL_61_12]